ncbi:hypothetical protein KKH56_06725 [bacterium]|nr:hypothetical protein [bacterium]
MSIILILGLAGNGFPETVTNQQILEKLNSLEVKIARLETKVEEGQKNLQKQIDGLDNKLSTRIESVENLLYVILAGMFALVGFVIWDRRTALAPAVKEMETVKKRDEKIVRILQEYALKEPKLAAVMRNVAL